MKLRNDYCELLKLRERKNATDKLKRTGIASLELNKLFSEEDAQRLKELKNEMKEKEDYFTVDYSILLSEIQKELDKQVCNTGGNYWEIKVKREVQEEVVEDFYYTKSYNHYHYLVSLKFGEKEFSIAEISTVNNDIYFNLYSCDSNEKVSLLDADTDINIEKLTTYQLNPPKKKPIGYMNALERGVWNAIKRNRVLDLMNKMTEKQNELNKAENKVKTLTTEIQTLQAEIKDAEM